jgi:hypothetical protein
MNTQNDLNLADPGNDPLAQSVNEAMSSAAAGTVFETTEFIGSQVKGSRFSATDLRAALSANQERTRQHIQLLVALVAMIAALTIIVPQLFR